MYHAQFKILINFLFVIEFIKRDIRAGCFYLLIFHFFNILEQWFSIAGPR